MDIKTVFLIFGISLACFAVIVSFIGLRVKDFPSRKALVGLLLARSDPGRLAPQRTPASSSRSTKQEQREEGDSRSAKKAEPSPRSDHSRRPA